MRTLTVVTCLLTACSTEEVVTVPEPVSIPEASVGAPIVAEEVESAPMEGVRPTCPTQVVDPTILTAAIEELNDNRNRGKLLSWNEEYCDHCDYYNVYLVFVDKKTSTRYTVWYNPDPETVNDQVALTGHMAVWERPDGTYADKFIETYSDDGFDGCVESGVGDQLAHVMRWNYGYGVPDEGLEHHSYWQERYNKAILALVDVLDVH